jgi:plasmid maintenance system antidote protein VapI
MRQKVVKRPGPAGGASERHVDLRVEIARKRVRQGVIAAAVGISEGHLSHLLAGRKPLSDEMADQIAKAIDEAAS